MANSLPPENLKPVLSSPSHVDPNGVETHAIWQARVGRVVTGSMRWTRGCRVAFGSALVAGVTVLPSERLGASPLAAGADQVAVVAHESGSFLPADQAALVARVIAMRGGAASGDSVSGVDASSSLASGDGGSGAAATGVASLAGVASGGAASGNATSAVAAPVEGASGEATSGDATAPGTSPAPEKRAHDKVVYLTFDDGPDPRYTPRVLDLLAEYDAPATFFMIGEKAVEEPELVERVRAAGHSIGNHTYTHPWLTDLTKKGMSSELERTTAVIGKTRCMRPPGGFTSAAVRKVSRDLGMNVVMWDADSTDWQQPGVNTIVDRISKRSGNGSVVLMHDGGGPREQSVEALARVLPRFAKAGYRFELLSECR